MNQENDIRIIIADTQFLTNTALEKILADEYSIIETVATRSELLKCMEEYPESLVIMDTSLFDIHIPSDLDEMKKQFPQVKFLVLTNTVNETEFSELTDAGIRNILFKTTDKAELLRAVEFSLQGKKYYPEEVLDLLLKKNNDTGIKSEFRNLTSSETEIVRLIAEGLTTKEIAARKFISIYTVMTHRKNIFRKLGVNSVSELIIYAIKAGWIDNIEYYI